MQDEKLIKQAQNQNTYMFLLLQKGENNLLGENPSSHKKKLSIY